MSAIALALLSLLFAALLEISYKRFSALPHSRGMYVAGIGVVWGVTQMAIAAWTGEALSWSGLAIGFGLAAGIAVAASNILLIEAMTRVEVSLGSTIYRLNTVGVVLLSVLLLGETLGPFKLLAIALGVIAALALYGGTRSGPDSKVLQAYFFVAVAASVLRACFGVASKAGLNHGVTLSVILLISAGCWVVGGLVYAALRERNMRVTPDVLGYIVVSGTLVVLVVNTLVLGLARGDASLVIPIANLSFVVALTISIALGMERLTARKVAALSLAAGCVWSMSLV